MADTMKELIMTFGTASGSRSSISLESPKSDLTAESVQTAMQALIDSEVLVKKDDDKYTTVYGAKIVETTETQLI